MASVKTLTQADNPALKNIQDPYFVFDLPAQAPSYIHYTKQTAFGQTMRTVAERMWKLEEAWQKHCKGKMQPQTFAKYAKTIFDSWFDQFEKMSAETLAAMVMDLHKLDGTEARARLDFPNCDVVVDTAFTTGEEWVAIRHLGIGGSDSSVVMETAHAYRSRYDLYHDKCWTPRQESDDGKQAIFDRGHYLEPMVIQTFCEMVGAEVIPETRMFRSRKYPHALADMDAVIHFPGPDTYYIFEAKSSLQNNAYLWYGGSNTVPPNYVTQCTHYPAVLNDPRIKGTYIGCLFTTDYTIHGNYVGSDVDVGKFVSRLIERSPVEEEMELGVEEQFFNEYILTGIEPDLHGDGKKDIASLNAIIGPADRTLEPVDLDSSLSETITDYLSLKEKVGILKAQTDEMEQEMLAKAKPLIAALGQAVEGRLEIIDSIDGEYWEVKNAPRPQTKVDKDVLEHKFPDAFRECVSTNPDAFRVFTIKRKAPKADKKGKK